VHQREHKIVRVGRGSCGHRQNDGQVDAVPGAEQTQAEGCKGGRHPNTRVSLRIRYPLPQRRSECPRYLLLQSGTFLLINRTQPLLHRNLSERRELLQQHFEPVDFEFQFAKSSDCENTEDIQAFLDESVKDGCEGLMVKMLESEASYYEPSRRSVNWLKVSTLHLFSTCKTDFSWRQLKKDYLAGVGDSLDLVVVGGYYGKGKRTNVYGAFLLACYDVDSEEYQTICKIGTGFSEEALASHYAALQPLETEKARGDVKVGGAKPDVWFEPKVVWEVLTADLSLSPVYTAAQGLVGAICDTIYFR
jgi:DNA ligase-1